MGHAVQSTETVQGVDKTCNEADNLIFPACIVDPSLENEFGRSMSGRASDDSDQDHQPSDLEIKQRKFVQARDSLVSKHNHRSSNQIQALINDKGLPRLNLERLVIESYQSHHDLSEDDICGRRGENP